MNKKLLSVVIGAALAGSVAGFSSVAQADVQLYGQLDVSIDSHDCDGAYGGNCAGYTDYKGFSSGDNSQTMNMNGNYSYFGIKGSEDLGNGLKAIFNVMFAFDPASNGGYGGGVVSGTERWLGLAGDFGTFRAGTVTTPYSDHGAMIDPFYGTSLEGNKAGLQSFYLHDEFASDEYADGISNRTVRYDSPDMNGLGGGVFYTMPNESESGNDGNPYGLGAHYKNGNILAFADYITSDEDVGSDDNTAWDIGGQYTMGNIGLFGMYESGGLLFESDLTEGLSGGESGASLWHLGGSFKMGNTLAYVAYGQGDDDTGADESEYSAWTLGVKHNLSVRTSVYAGFNQIDEDLNGQTDHFGLGMNVKF